jgi:hypothetical protein
MRGFSFDRRDVYLVMRDAFGPFRPYTEGGDERGNRVS